MIALVFGFLWVRDVTRDMTAPEVEVEPTTREVAPLAATPGVEPDDELVVETEEPREYSRSVFLEASTLGIAVAIGGIVTLPILGFAVPTFTDKVARSTSGRWSFPENQFVIATAPRGTRARRGQPGRTAYIRSNGEIEGQPASPSSSSRCVHLGCPGSAQRPGRGRAAPRSTRTRSSSRRRSRPASAAVPRRRLRHGGTPHRRPAVRSMDRYQFGIKEGNLFVEEALQRRHRRGGGAEAKMTAYRRPYPGVHVDGIEAWLYPIEVRNSHAVETLADEDGAAHRSTGSTSAPASSAASSTSSSGRCRTASTGCRRSARQAVAFLVQAGTGVILAFYYKPSPNEAYDSVVNITNELTLG